MKVDTVLIVIVVLLLVAFAAIGALNTMLAEKQAALEAIQAETDRLAAAAYWTRIRAQPRPHSPPLEAAVVSSGCGHRLDPMGGSTEGLHKGVDLVGPIGAPVRAVLAGTVAEHWLAPGWHWGKQYHGDPVFGGKIVLDHGEGLYSIYGHLSATFVHEGERIEAGQVIGELGNTGISTGPHLHLEIVVDPLRYLEER